MRDQANDRRCIELSLIWIKRINLPKPKSSVNPVRHFQDLFNLTLRKNAAVSLASVFVSLRGLVALFRRNLGRLLAPALINGLQTPFGAAARGADRLVADDDEDRIGV